MIGSLKSIWRYRRYEYRPVALFAILLVLFFLLPVLRSDSSIDVVNFKNILETLAALGLITLGLGLTMVAGEFDLSVSSTFLLGGMLAVKTGVDSPLLGVLVAVGVGAAVGLIQGLLISRLNLNSMGVTLGGFIALLGLVFVISNSESISFANLGVGESLDQAIAGIFSLRILLAIAIFLAVAVIFTRTSWGRDLRAIGSDRKASLTAGVRVGPLVVAVFVLSAVLCSLAGALQGYSLSYATPDRTVAPLIFATTAALLGGVSLSGGRGNPFGIAGGVLSLALIIEAIPILGSPEYVNTLVPAVLLMTVTIIDAPQLLTWWKSIRSGNGSSDGGEAVDTAGAD